MKATFIAFDRKQHELGLVSVLKVQESLTESHQTFDLSEIFHSNEFTQSVGQMWKLLTIDPDGPVDEAGTNFEHSQMAVSAQSH